MTITLHKKILIIIPSLQSGGIQRYVLRFIDKYHNQLDISVICKNNIYGELEKEYKLYSSKIYKFKLGYFNVIDYLRFYFFLKNNKYDTVCDFTGNFAALPLLAAKFAGVEKRIAFYRGSTNRFDDTHKLKRTYNGFLLRLIPFVSTKILSNSKAALNFFYKNKWKNDPKFKVIYNGINALEFQKNTEHLRQVLNIPAHAFVIGHTGRFDKSKNFDTLFKVAKKLCQLSPDNYFIFCGRDTDANLSKQINEHGLDKQVFALGYRSDIPRVLNTLDCFYFPSYTEGQPNSLLEAMISNIPFVASNIEAINEIIPNSLKSQLINPDDDMLAIEKILEIKENNRKIKEMMRHVRFNNKFDNNQLFKQFYEEI